MSDPAEAAVELVAEPVTGRPLPARVTAAVDVLTSRERHADELALTCEQLLREHAGRDIVVSSHWAVLGERRHVALSVEVCDLDEDVVTRLLSVATEIREGSEHGMQVGGTFIGPAALQPVLADVLTTTRARSGGRAIVFPGSTTATGTITVGQLLASSRIDCVRVLGSGEPDADTPLVTRDFVRPLWSGGELVLHAQPAVGGVLVPFETPDPTPCCAAHT